MIRLNLFQLARFSGIKTCLNALHVEHHGKLVQFAGYELPVQYKAGIMKQHLHCRDAAALFDVSHMGQLTITGKDALNLLQTTTVGSTDRRKKGEVVECYLTMFLNPNAGIIDDAIATVLSHDSVRMVVNGANKHKVVEHLNNVRKQGNLNVNIKLEDEKGLIALQGPKAAGIVAQIFKQFDFKMMPFMSQIHAKWNGNEYLLSRSGYTGEDGFQISSSGSSVVSITKRLLEDKNVGWAGLGARDSLRLEAGLCLHGNDISEEISPLQANLMWTVHKRSANDSRLKFIGEDALVKLSELVKEKKKLIRKRVGYMVDGPGIVRDHCKLFSGDKEIGVTTSGTYSPTLKGCVGMAYVDQSLAKEGSKFQAELRGKRFNLIVKKMPFVPSRYYDGWSTFK